MTHLEKFIELYTEFGIECKVNQHSDQQAILFSLFSWVYDDRCDGEAITYSTKFGGYNYFYSRVIFDLEGNFMRQEFWE